jgi:methylated-DNA-[protein]-cysteine S-methyltransferase
MKYKSLLRHLPADSTYDEIDSPVGMLTLISSDKGLHALLWECNHEHTFRKSPNEKTILKTKKQLDEYFAGKRKHFDIPLVMHGTEFQNQAWLQLQQITYGETISYGEQSLRLGDKNKARAVGMANGRNPISIIVPCHRVIGANGSLTGFGGGIDRKKYLLALEQS